MKKNNLFCIIRLYLSFHLNKLLGIIFFIIMILWILILVLSSGFPISTLEYIMDKHSFHSQYLEDSLFFLQIMNGAFLAFLIGSEANSISCFDSMFVAHTERKKIVFAKIITNAFLCLIILFLEILFLFGIAILVFPSFICKISDFLLVGYLFLSYIELILIGEILSILFNTFFISFLIFILHLVMHLISKINKLHNFICYLTPKIKIIHPHQFQLDWNIGVYLCICFLLVLLILILYQKKDINT